MKHGPRNSHDASMIDAFLPESPRTITAPVFEATMTSGSRSLRSGAVLLTFHCFRLIAIMLGRLRMTLKECEDAYTMLSQNIFTPVRKNVDPRRLTDFLKANGKFDEHPLEESIKNTIRMKKMDEETLLQEFDQDPDQPCKVFVCATRGGRLSERVISQCQLLDAERLD